jgi:hypothetical protein
VASLGEVPGKEEPAFRSRKASRQRGKVVIKSSSGDESTQVPGGGQVGVDVDERGVSD